MPSVQATVESCLEGIAAREAEVKAWVHVDAAGARAQARALERRPSRGPLHGTPVGIKDIIDVAGMPTGHNSPIYSGYLPRADAAVVALLRRAGCVIVGKTATAEFAYLHPAQTRNPHNMEHTPGGSSSGSAAAVAAGMVPLALGTQTGGSIIRPAAFCGVVGLKPSFGAINRAGVKPVAESLDTVGVFARTVEEAAIALHVLSSRPMADFSSARKFLRVGFCRTSRWRDADASTHAALESAASRIAAKGCEVEELVLPPAVEAIFEQHGDVIKFEAARALAWEHSEHRDAISPGLLKRLDEGWAIPQERYAAARRTAVDARAQFAELMRGFDVLLTPAAHGEAPKGIGSTGDSLFNRIWTLLGVPCVSIPFGAGPSGLPLGLQLVGAMDQDEALLRNAAAITQLLAA